MRYVYPHYYQEFVCTADACPDTCCTGWQIMIDEKTLEKYERHVGHFAKRLEQGVDWNKSCFKQDLGGRCCMLNEKGLCELQLHLGEEFLCTTCAQFPRHVEEFEGLREWSLSLSCPVAAHLVLSCPEPVRFIEEKDEDDDPLIEDFRDFDFLLFTELEDARDVIFTIVQNRDLPISVRVRCLLNMSRALQICVEENRISDMQEVVRAFAAMRQGDPVPYSEELKLDYDEPSERYSFLEENFSILNRLELLREDWAQVLSEENDLLAQGETQYYELRSRFVSAMEREPWWDVFRENYLLSFIYTYFIGAVYDDWIDTKILLAVFSLIFTEEFIMNEWKRKGAVTPEVCERIAYRYVREVEHSDLNLNALEDFLHAFLFSPA